MTDQMWYAALVTVCLFAWGLLLGRSRTVAKDLVRYRRLYVSAMRDSNLSSAHIWSDQVSALKREQILCVASFLGFTVLIVWLLYLILGV